MKIVRPLTINDAALISSNAGETVALYSAASVYVTGNQVRDDTTHRIYESLTGTNKGAATMTIASPCEVTSVAHGLVAGTPIMFTTTGALPTGLVAGTIYYVLAPAANTFNVAATVGGAAINTSGSQSGTHTLIASPNKGNAVSDITKWLDVAPANTWSMFDQVNGTVTTGATGLDVTIQPVGRVDSVALLNVDVAQIQVTVTDATDGVIYDQTFSMVSDSGITDWYAYFYEPIIRKTDLIITDILPYYAPSVRVQLSASGAAVSVGSMLSGLSREIGSTGYGASLGITDYSRKEADDYGNYTLVQRSFNRRGTFKLMIGGESIDSTAGAVDDVYRILSDLRAIPSLYIGSDIYGSTAIFGFYRDFNVEISYPTASFCTLEIEGLT